jgi:hypothetical protein
MHPRTKVTTWAQRPAKNRHVIRGSDQKWKLSRGVKIALRVRVACRNYCRGTRLNQ